MINIELGHYLTLGGVIFLLGVVVGVVLLFLFYIFYLRVVEVARKSKK